MTHTRDLLAIDVANANATMPVAPSDATIPIFKPHPDVIAVHQHLADLHYIAFVALNGLPPQHISIQRTMVGPAGRQEPRYFAALSNALCGDSLRWFDKFRAGLTNWYDSEFSDPITVSPADLTDLDGPVTVFTIPRAIVLTRACERLKASAKIGFLQNLKALLGDEMPDEFDPDHPAYNGAADKG